MTLEQWFNRERIGDLGPGHLAEQGWAFATAQLQMRGLGREEAASSLSSLASGWCRRIKTNSIGGLGDGLQEVDVKNEEKVKSSGRGAAWEGRSWASLRLSGSCGSGKRKVWPW